MRRANVLSGSAFRSAALSAALFLLVLAVAGWAIVNVTVGSMHEQIQSYINEDLDLIHDAATGGERELVRFIEKAVETRSDKQFAFGLFDTSGKRLAGNIMKKPTFTGWGTLALQPSQAAGDTPFYAYVEKLGARTLVVGRSQRAEGAMGSSILTALLFSGLVIAIAALGIGYVSSRRVSGKLQVIDDTLAKVSRGDTAVRLPISRSNDQIDHVSREINAHLDRLSEFMAAMRNTIVAIAHDLRSPLSRAFMLLQEAEAAREPKQAAELLERAQAEMESLGEIMDTVLRISRIESSDDSSGFEVFSATALLKDLAQTFEPVTELAGQTLRCTVPATDVALFGDRRMVQQMLVNLIENASRHGPGGTHIELNLAERIGGPVLIVSDDGPGIPPERHDDVLQPFFRLGPDRHAPGAGLGLALVKAVAVRHRARIELADNRPGLRVVISFPPVPAGAIVKREQPRPELAELAAGATRH